MTCKYVTNPKYLLLCYFLSIVYYVHILAFSIKSGNQGTSTLTLVQKRVRFLKIPSKKHISLQGGGGGDMPFRAWPHTGTIRGGAPWWCEMVPSWRTGVRLPSSSNRFGPGGHEHGSKGFLSGAAGWAKCSLTLWGHGHRVFPGPCLRGKKRETWSSPASSFQFPPKGSNLVSFPGGLGWESVGG
jgi:hypothetical protein